MNFAVWRFCTRRKTLFPKWFPCPREDLVPGLCPSILSLTATRCSGETCSVRAARTVVGVLASQSPNRDLRSLRAFSMSRISLPVYKSPMRLMASSGPEKVGHGRGVGRSDRVGSRVRWTVPSQGLPSTPGRCILFLKCRLTLSNSL